MTLKKRLFLGAMLVGLTLGGAAVVWAEDAAAPAAAPAAGAPAGGLEMDEKAKEAKHDSKITFWQVMTHSGFMGLMVWLGIFACSGITLALAIDGFIKIRDKILVPPEFVESIRAAMAAGDVFQAVKECEGNTSPLSKVLAAGFSNVQEGFEVIQDAVAVAADMESEKLLQKVGILNVIFNVAPMIGLIGTVQGMINAFSNLASTAGAAQQSMLALSISESLWCTAAGLIIAVPALSFFQYFRNRVIRFTLSMEALTLDLIKVLKNVEVVAEE